jgi:hypothetical protein
MEGNARVDVPARLTRFLDEVATFLHNLSDEPAFGNEREREALAKAVTELRDIQMVGAQDDLRGVGEDDLLSVGFSPRQTVFKLDVAERAMTEALEPSLSGRRRPSKILRAADKIRTVLASIKSLSKWLEAIDELVAMAGELAKNHLGPNLR